MLDAMVLAGNGVIKDSDYIGNKALLPIHGKTMIEYVIEALCKSSYIGRILIIGPKKDLQSLFMYENIEIIEATGTIIDNIIAGINYLDSNKNLLICTSDIPLLTPESVDDFISGSKELNADLSYPIVSKSLNEKLYPYMKRTYVKLKDGTFTGGNLFYVNPQVISRCTKLARDLFEARKNPFKMAQIISFSVLFQLAIGTLTIEKIEKRFSKILDVKAKAIISDYPELANDVDKSSDILCVTSLLSSKLNR